MDASWSSVTNPDSDCKFDPGFFLWCLVATRATYTNSNPGTMGLWTQIWSSVAAWIWMSTGHLYLYGPFYGITPPSPDSTQATGSIPDPGPLYGTS